MKQNLEMWKILCLYCKKWESMFRRKPQGCDDESGCEPWTSPQPSPQKLGIEMGFIPAETLPAGTKGSKENKREWRKAVNIHYPSRKGKKDPKGDSEIIRTAIPTTDPECKGWGARLPLRWSCCPAECQVDGPLQNARCVALRGSQGYRAALLSHGDDTTTPVGLEGRATAPVGPQWRVSKPKSIIVEP